MITTLDNQICKRGEVVFEIGTNGKFVKPIRGIVHGGHNGVANPEACWKSFDLCQKECDRRNSLEARKKTRPIEDNLSKICIAFGEKRISKIQFEDACSRLKHESLFILKDLKLI